MRAGTSTVAPVRHPCATGGHGAQAREAQALLSRSAAIMRSFLRPASMLLLTLGLLASCGGGGGGGGGGAGFLGVWQYQQGSFSFVNCYTTSRTVDLTRSGFQIVDEAGTLVRKNPDGCRFKVVQTTATHAGGVAGEECTVSGTDGLGNPMTTLYKLKSLLMELKPSDASQMIEVFSLDATQTSTLGTFTCEISGSNTLDRAP